MSLTTSPAPSDLRGRSSILAAQIAVEDFGGSVLGKSISIVSTDSQNKPDITAGIARRWFDAEHVDAIIDPAPSSVALAIEDLARECNRMVIAASSGLADITGSHCSPTTFQWAYDASVLAKSAAAATAEQRRGAKGLARNNRSFSIAPSTCERSMFSLSVRALISGWALSGSLSPPTSPSTTR